MVIQTLIHEYIHYLQSPIWFKRYYSMGHDYVSHPYEKEAISYEKRLQVIYIMTDFQKVSKYVKDDLGIDVKMGQITAYGT